MDEFRVGLALATIEELCGLTTLLFKRRFNPLDYMLGADPAQVRSVDHQLWLNKLDQRFRFLAADGVTVLRQRTRRLSYHYILTQVCRYLKADYSSDWSVIEVEESIFLHLLDVAYHTLPVSEQQKLEQHFHRQVTLSLRGQSFFSVNQKISLRLVLEGGSALLIHSWVKPWLLRYMAERVALQIARYQFAKHVLMGGGVAVGTLQNRVMMSMARRGVALNLARYSAARSVLAVLGPAMWTWFLADLGWRAIATNYGRIIPVIFTIAQIRLLRTEAVSLKYCGGVT